MGSTNITELGKMFPQGQFSSAGGVSIQEDDNKFEFMDVMNRVAAQMDQSMISGNPVTGKSTGKESVDIQTSADALDAHTYRGNNIKERPEIAEDGKQQQVIEKADAFADDVKEVLEEELGVTEEQIAEAMETLGLTYAELLNPKALADLVAELTGCQDVGTLLCNNEFLQVVQAVGELGEHLLKELGISKEELIQLCENAEDVPQSDTVKPAEEQADLAEGVQTEDSQIEALKTVPDQTADDGIVSTDEVNMKNLTENQKAAEETAEDTVVSVKNSKEQSGQETADALTPDEKTDMENSDIKENPLQKQDHSSQNGQMQNGQAQHGANEAAAFGQNLHETAYTLNAGETAGFSEQVDVQNIIRQIVEFSKVTLGNAETTMQMQLNPEHLGKIYLEITAKEGNVSAHILTQNEVVREALESQIADLKQNMNQAGIKVDAVEVSVGSHEFERNLEQNAKQEEQQAEQQEKTAKQTRKINLNDLNELNGIMTEEETLVAQMMSEQGNSVDFTA